MSNIIGNLPDYRTRSEKEMAETLHKYRVLARKRQIQLQIQDNILPNRPLDISSYIVQPIRINLFKSIKELLLMFIP